MKVTCQGQHKIYSRSFLYVYRKNPNTAYYINLCLCIHVIKHVVPSMTCSVNFGQNIFQNTMAYILWRMPKVYLHTNTKPMIPHVCLEGKPHLWHRSPHHRCIHWLSFNLPILKFNDSSKTNGPFVELMI